MDLLRSLPLDIIDELMQLGDIEIKRIESRMPAKFTTAKVITRRPSNADSVERSTLVSARAPIHTVIVAINMKHSPKKS